MATITKDADIHVSYEDQQKINKFARLNAQYDELTDQFKEKQKERQDLEDSESELLLSADELTVPYKLGEVFIYLTEDEARAMIESRKNAVQEELLGLREKQASVKRIMSELKVQLYAKFGNNINLESDDS